jgi:hypothetical protein
MNCRNRIISAFLAGSFVASGITAAAQGGSTSYDFLNIPTAAHTYALGGTNLTLIEEDINQVSQNPALMGPEMDMQLGLNYMHYIGNINLAGVTFGMAATERSAWAAGIQYFGYGKMTQTEADGTIVGTFSPQDVVFNGLYSHEIFRNFRGGINLKLVYSAYEKYSALAMAVDLGVNYYNPNNDLSLSLVFKNLGGQLKRFNDIHNPLPWDIQIGYSQSLALAPIRFSVTARHLNRWSLPYPASDNQSGGQSVVTKNNFADNLFRHLIFGVEYLPTDYMYIGLGYNYKTRTDMKTDARNILSGFSIGAGIRVRMFSVGVAVAQQHIKGTTVMVNLTTNLYEFKR